MGSKTHTKQSTILTIRPPTGRCVLSNIQRGEAGGNLGGGSRGGRTPGRGTADRDQGGDEGGRSQVRDRKDPEQEEPGGTQSTAIMVAHGGADGGRSHGGGMAADSRGPSNGSGAGGGGARGENGEPTIQGDAEDPGGQSVAEGSGDQGGGGDPEICGRAGVTEDQVELTEGRSPTEPEGWSDEAQPRGEESRGDGGSTPDQGRAGGTREPRS